MCPRSSIEAPHSVQPTACCIARAASHLSNAHAGNAVSLLPAGNPLGLPAGFKAKRQPIHCCVFCSSAPVRARPSRQWGARVWTVAELPNFTLTQCHTQFGKSKKFEIVTFFKLARLSFMSGNESAMTLRWPKNAAGR